VLMVIGIVISVLILIVAGVAFYFYNYHVFKEVRVCIGEAEDVGLSCEVRADCLEAFNISLDSLDDSPEFVAEKVGDVLERSVYCEGSCFVRAVRGIDFESGGLEELENCKDGEEEIVMEIHGKEGLEVLEWMRNRE